MKTLFLAFALLILSSIHAYAADKVFESAHDRVIKSGVIKCGYGVWPPIIIKDVNTGELSGIYYDYMTALAKSIGVKVEWTEISWNTFPVDLNSGRIDAMCAGIWPAGARAREMDFTIPVNYVVINTYVRADDNRFDNALEKINSADITVSAMDGEMSSIVAQADFPNAKVLSLPSTASPPQIMLNVADGKADVTFSEAYTAGDFMVNNPGKLKPLPGGELIRVFGNTIAVGEGQIALKEMLDTGTNELLQSGVIEKILRKYEKVPNAFYRVAKPYQTHQ